MELAVTDLGVIDSVSLVPGPGLTAITGETGAGKTLLVGALGLLLGDRADPGAVRAGASEAVVEARLGDGDGELVVSRVIPADGRSRAYVDGRLATAGEVAERTAAHLELHGQDVHQALRSTTAQRSALDRFGQVDLTERVEASRRLAEVEAAIEAIGGDDRTRAREVALLRHEIAEIDAAALGDPDEPDRLAEQEDALVRADAARTGAELAHSGLRHEDGVLDRLASLAASLEDLPAPLPGLARRLTGIAAELDDAAAELRSAAERFEPDPARLDQVHARRRLLIDLFRRYGDDVSAVLAHAEASRERLTALEGYEERAATLEADRERALARLQQAEQAVAAARRKAAPRLAAAVVERLAALALPRAVLECAVDGPAGDHVELQFTANPGEPLRPLAKVASGGELSRTMLALRLVLAGGPATLVFDEVDAGVGGEAGLAVGTALAEVAAHHQVIVITHLPQVAAHAHHQVVVSKEVVGGRAVTRATRVDGGDRVAELARMLAGRADSETGRRHAAELLETAQA